ncbi:MAG: hypothetical protein HY739_08605 [Desulfobacterales bacterium]|nr:hypothetical protein [Desulfobacterales bacterium]
MNKKEGNKTVTAYKDENIQNGDVSDLNRPTKLLSICIFGRDDDYMLDFRYRITTTMNHLARSIKNLGQQDKVEILVTDWGSHIPMAQALELSPEVAEVCRFIYVPPDVIRDTQEGKDYFHVSRASNVAIRRASGKYIMVYPADTLIQEHLLEQMLRLLKGEIRLPIEVERTFFMLPRMDVPWQFIERQPTIEEWDRYLLLMGKNTPLEPVIYFGFGGAGALMMHRDLWHKFRGVDERMAGWGYSDTEIGFRITRNHPFCSLSGIGVFIYHMAHKSEGRRRDAILQTNPIRFNINEKVNDENWGLGNFELTTQVPQKVCAAVRLESKYPKNTPTCVESMSQSFGEIVSELTSKKLIRSLKPIVMSYLSRGGVLDREETNALFFLSWYSLSRFPHRYLDFFIGGNSGTGVVATMCPSVEVYKVDRWEGIQTDDSPLALLNMLYTFQFRGYIRFVNGEIRTAIQRLKDSFFGSFGFDLMLVGGKIADEVTDDQVCNLISYLSPGGALVLSYSSSNDFLHIWQKIKDNYGQYTYFRCEDQKTGMVLAANLRDNENQEIFMGDVRFDTRWLTSIRIIARFLKVLRQSLRQFYRHSVFHSRLKRFAQYLKILLRQIGMMS